jgi:hypothetical protein
MREGTGTWDQLKQLAPWSNWLLSYSCCGPQVSARLGQYAQLERDPLMGGSISPPEEQMMAGGTNLVSHPSASSAEAGPRLLLVMRHAHREDEDNEDWAVMAARPWDPPLSQLGRRQAREAAQVLAAQQGQLQIDYVVSSPYLRYKRLLPHCGFCDVLHFGTLLHLLSRRCLQTSAELVAALQLPEGRWLVDWAMGEVRWHSSSQCSLPADGWYDHRMMPVMSPPTIPHRWVSPGSFCQGALTWKLSLIAGPLSPGCGMG